MRSLETQDDPYVRKLLEWLQQRGA
jgi:hypothetical protein